MDVDSEIINETIVLIVRQSLENEVIVPGFQLQETYRLNNTVCWKVSRAYNGTEDNTINFIYSGNLFARVTLLGDYRFLIGNTLMLTYHLHYSYGGDNDSDGFHTRHPGPSSGKKLQLFCTVA